MIIIILIIIIKLDLNMNSEMKNKFAKQTNNKKDDNNGVD
jgi:hypothetical protein